MTNELKSQSLMHKLNFPESHPLRENPCWIRHRELSLCNDWRQPGTIQALHIRFQKNFLLWLPTRPVLPGTGLEGQKYILDAFWRVIWAALGLTRPKPKMHCPLACCCTPPRTLQGLTNSDQVGNETRLDWILLTIFIDIKFSFLTH